MQEDTYTGEYNDPLSLNLYTYYNNDPLMYSDPTGHSTLDDYEYQKNVGKRRNTLSSTLDNYSYQNTTKITSSRQSNSLDNYYYNQDMTDAHLLQQTRELQKAPQTITSTAKSATNDRAMISFLLNPDTSAYLTSGQYQQTLAWVDQERIDRGGSILISGLQLSTDPTSKGYNERDLALYQAINKITCFNGDIGNTDKLLNTIENRYTALNIDSSNALNLDAQGMKNLSAVAADRNKAVNGGTGFNLLKFQEENLFGSGIASTVVTGFTYGALMTTYAGSGPQQTTQTNSDIIDAQVATGNVEYAKTMNALTDEQWAAMSGSGEAGVAGGVLGGAYKDITRTGGEIHHMPADSVSPLSKSEGPAVNMDTIDHRQTASWGNSKEAQLYRAQQKSLIEQGDFAGAQQMDINDLITKFGNKYNQGILQMQKYTNDFMGK